MLTGALVEGFSGGADVVVSTDPSQTTLGLLSTVDVYSQLIALFSVPPQSEESRVFLYPILEGESVFVSADGDCMVVLNYDDSADNTAT